MMHELSLGQFKGDESFYATALLYRNNPSLVEFPMPHFFVPSVATTLKFSVTDAQTAHTIKLNPLTEGLQSVNSLFLPELYVNMQAENVRWNKIILSNGTAIFQLET